VSYDDLPKFLKSVVMDGKEVECLRLSLQHEKLTAKQLGECLQRIRSKVAAKKTIVVFLNLD
jgi:hypothetical protein